MDLIVHFYEHMLQAVQCQLHLTNDTYKNAF